MSKNIGHLEATLGLNTLGLTRGLATAQARMRAAGAKMKAIGRTMTMTMTLPLLAIGGGAIKMAADFEKSMSKIEGLVGIAGDKVRAFRADVMRLSGQTARSPQELADALFFVTSAGLRGADAIDVLTASAKASAAGLGETKVIADLVTSAVNAYGIENLSAAKATDILTAAVREGKAEAPELAESLGQVLPIAAALGVTFDQVGASVAAMTRTGTKSATAAIQLRQILASLLKPSQQAEESFAKMNTSSMDLRKILREDGLIATFKRLQEGIDSSNGAAEGLVSVYGAAFPNIRALSGALDIMGANSEENEGIFARMTNTTGDMEKAFGVAAKTVDFQFKQALSELKVEMISLGVTLMPIFKSILGAVRSGVNWFKNLSDAGKRMSLTIGGILLVAGPLISVLGVIATLVAAITWPIALVIVAVAALTVAFLYAADNWDAITERITDWSWWKNLIIDMANFLIKNNPMAWLWKGFKLIIPLMDAAWNFLKETIGDITWWKNMLGSMASWFNENNPMSLMMDAYAWITGTAVPAYLKAATGALNTVSNAADDITKGFDWEGFWSDPFETMATNVDTLKDKTIKAKTEFGSFSDAMVNGANAATAAIGSIFSGLGGGGGGGTVAAPTYKVKGATQVDRLGEAQDKGYQVAGSAGNFTKITGRIEKDYKMFVERLEKLQETDTSNWRQWQFTLAEIWTNIETEGRLSFQQLMDVLDEALQTGQMLSGLISQAFVSLGQSIGNSLAGMDDKFKTPLQSILLIVADFATQLGSMLISIGSLMLMSGIFTGAGAGILAAGLGLVIIGSAGAAMINKSINGKREAAAESERNSRNMTGMRTGGFVTDAGAFQLHKDEVVSLPAGANVKSQRDSRMGANVQIADVKIKGEDMYLIFKDAERRLGNSRG